MAEGLSVARESAGESIKPSPIKVSVAGISVAGGAASEQPFFSLPGQVTIGGLSVARCAALHSDSALLLISKTSPSPGKGIASLPLTSSINLSAHNLALMLGAHLFLFQPVLTLKHEFVVSCAETWI